MIKIHNLYKNYADGFKALSDISLEIDQREIFALLGPNGAGKTTLINILCGLVNPSEGQIKVGGFDVINEYRQARALIGLVPQELTTPTFETVWDTVCFSRELFGKKPDADFIEKTLRDLSLFEKRNNKILTLSGGMKRRVMIAKALAHEPKVLFLDEPTAGVDVELRKDMWDQIHELRESGVTIILTTHYIEEAEKMADRVGVIHQGELIVVEKKKDLMKKLGKKKLILDLAKPVSQVPEGLKRFQLQLDENGSRLIYEYDSSGKENDIPELMEGLRENGFGFSDLNVEESTLEEIFVGLVNQK
jgi:ABC-2 type transport system ATP-binding protein